MRFIYRHSIVSFLCFYLYCFAFIPSSFGTDLVKKGKFYCTRDGKLVLSRGGSGYGSKIYCITPDGRKYNAIDGSIVSYGENNKTHTNAISKKGSGKNINKDTLVINNYHFAREAPSNAKSYSAERKNKNNLKAIGDREVWAREKNIRFAPFSGVYIGLRGGMEFGNLSENLSQLSRSIPSVPSSSSNLFHSSIDQTISSPRIAMILGGNFQINKRFLIGLEMGGSLLAYDQFPLPIDAHGDLLPYYLNSIRGVIDFQLRLGVIARNTTLFYFGVGSSSFLVNETKDTKSAHGQGIGYYENSVFIVSPKFSVGIDWLIGRRVGIRLEYAIIYSPSHASSTIYTDNSSNDWSLSYTSLRHAINGMLYFKF